ncbi:unnamed protein product [Mesocestoides corti]|uniref:Transmembrane protein n=1 Tax=Mesocestoides corti TaxID=53468 RepID=A0A0R3UJA3_MESCO|nr:unnamed protein product [Mesocestoides corti]
MADHVFALRTRRLPATQEFGLESVSVVGTMATITTGLLTGSELWFPKASIGAAVLQGMPASAPVRSMRYSAQHTLLQKASK